MAPPMPMGAYGMMAAAAQQQSQNPFEVLNDAQLAQYEDAEFGRHAQEAARGGDVPRIWRIDRSANRDKEERVNEADAEESRIDSVANEDLGFEAARNEMDDAAAQFDEENDAAVNAVEVGADTDAVTAAATDSEAAVDVDTGAEADAESPDFELGMHAEAELAESEGETNDGQPLDWDGEHDARFANVPSDNAEDLDADVDHESDDRNPDRQRETEDAEMAARAVNEDP